MAGEPPANVWIGATVVNQAEADRDVRKLLATPASVRFLSIEPMLGPINLKEVAISGSGHHEFDPIIIADVLRPWVNRPRVDWVICGGESGPSARPMHPQWARNLRDQCAAAGVPFMHKQWGEWVPADQSAAVREANGFYRIREFRHLDGHRMHLIGKKAAGRLLDGVMHDGIPAQKNGGAA